MSDGEIRWDLRWPGVAVGDMMGANAPPTKVLHTSFAAAMAKAAIWQLHGSDAVCWVGGCFVEGRQSIHRPIARGKIVPSLVCTGG